MFTSNIGRLRYFLYSAGLVLVEIVTTMLCIHLTMGIDGLANSKPGPSREGLAAAILGVSLVLVLVRGNFAWRRSRDARGSGWILWPYIVFSLFFAILQAATFLVVKFDGEDSHLGLNMLGLGLIGLWAVILAAKPAGGAPSGTSAIGATQTPPRAPIDGAVAAPAGRRGEAPRATAVRPAAPTVRLPNGQTGRAGFGRKGAS